MSSLRFVNPCVVQARLCKSYENEIEWSEGNSKIFIPSVFTEKKGEKNQRNQNDSESKKEGMKLNIGGVWRFEDRLE